MLRYQEKTMEKQGRISKSTGSHKRKEEKVQDAKHRRLSRHPGCPDKWTSGHQRAKFLDTAGARTFLPVDHPGCLDHPDHACVH